MALRCVCKKLGPQFPVVPTDNRWRLCGRQLTKLSFFASANVAAFSTLIRSSRSEIRSGPPASLMAAPTAEALEVV
jgi:hypothetical protein